MSTQKVKETPRQRITRFNSQQQYWSRYGYSPICQQSLCIICKHYSVWTSYEGESDVDCAVNSKIFDIEEQVLHCGKFKAIQDWNLKVENLLTRVLSDIINDLFGKQKNLF